MASFINADESEYPCPECGSSKTYENVHDQIKCKACGHETTVGEVADQSDGGSRFGGVL
ncbi:eukaryotic translation initiation factor eIF-2-beta/eIF-5 family protein [Natronobacterium lacisalsi]|uniref:hypothetical protein n=1 Tax=Natronobacterium lacisalsi TaxID=229731 RepID=UPI0012EB7B9A|nr:hypothetical protein [Halobiforma lacisalsi]